MGARSMLSRSLAGALTAGLLAVSLLACPGQTTVNQVTQHVQVSPVLGGGTWTGYTGTTFGETIPSSKKVTLLSATVSSSSGEFSFAGSLTGATAPDGGGEVLVQKATFTGATSPTPLEIMDTGDLLPLFPNQDFRIYWTMQFMPDASEQAYPNGIELTFTYSIQIE
jgi:hypothetical protein